MTMTGDIGDNDKEHKRESIRNVKVTIDDDINKRCQQ